MCAGVRTGNRSRSTSAAPSGFDRELADHTARNRTVPRSICSRAAASDLGTRSHAVGGTRTRAPWVERHRRAAARHDGAGIVAQQLLCRSGRCRRGRRRRPADLRRTRKSGIAASGALDLPAVLPPKPLWRSAFRDLPRWWWGCWPSCAPAAPSCHWTPSWPRRASRIGTRRCRRHAGAHLGRCRTTPFRSISPRGRTRTGPRTCPRQ